MSPPRDPVKSVSPSEGGTVTRRIIVLGHSGFIGGHILRTLREVSPDLELRGLSYPEFDLTCFEHAQSLAEEFTPETVVIVCAAIKRQLGDNLDAFSANVAMAVNLARVLEARPVKRVVFFSSAAVYGEEHTNLAINEETPIAPTSYYGAAKFTGESILRQACNRHPASSLVCLRPAQVYGPGDQAAYGPTGFLRAAREGRDIVLWGDGTERREFVYVEDVARLVQRLVSHPYAGPLNVVTGGSRSFAEAVDIVHNLVPLRQAPASRPRTKPKADHGFTAARLQGLFPDFSFTPLEEGIRRNLEALPSPPPSVS